MAIEWTWNDGLSARSRLSACLVVTADGEVHRFVGKDIPGTVKILNEKFEKNGKWSNTTYYCLSADGTAVISWKQDWENGLFWPQSSWQEAIEWVRSQAPLASPASVERLIREEWPKAAQKFDENAAAFSQMSQRPTRQRYLLNSAVITAPGSYEYVLLDQDAARDWLMDGEFISTCGYAETAQVLETLTGVPVPVNRQTIRMEPGDEALVFRLAFQPGQARINPGDKGALTPEFVRENCEFGILRRTR
jgi:hypothetical protein